MAGSAASATRQELVVRLRDSFGVHYATADEDLDRFLASLLEQGRLEG